MIKKASINHALESLALSILGMPGLTAYAGLIWQAKPQQGDVVLIPATPNRLTNWQNE